MICCVCVLCCRMPYFPAFCLYLSQACCPALQHVVLRSSGSVAGEASGNVERSGARKEQHGARMAAINRRTQSLPPCVRCAATSRRIQRMTRGYHSYSIRTALGLFFLHIAPGLAIDSIGTPPHLRRDSPQVSARSLVLSLALCGTSPSAHICTGNTWAHPAHNPHWD